MAIDGGMLHIIKKELENSVVGGRVEKISQPGNDEIFVTFRTLQGSVKVVMSANPSDARVHVTKDIPENPKVPPMLCMLFRKILGGARLVSIEQPGLERVLLFHFEGYNEIGDAVSPTVAMEIMGRYSNLILIDGEGKVIDAVRRVDASLSGKRLVLPGVMYQLPPPQEKKNLLTDTPESIALAMTQSTGSLSKAALKTMQGICPLVAREIACRVTGDDRAADELSQREKDALTDYLGEIKRILTEGTPAYTMISQKDGKPLDFSYLPIAQYGTEGVCETPDSAGELMDRFFAKRDSVQRIKNRSGELYKMLQTIISRLKRKIAAQEQDLLETEGRDAIREKADILSANMYTFSKGIDSVELDNYYTDSKITISLDPALTPVQNAQKYYSEYKRSCAAREHLTRLIEENRQELTYIESVFEFLHHAQTEEELNELREELRETGYIRSRGKKDKKPKKAKPLAYRSTDGNRIWVGRNNRQNEELTLRTARGNDMWFHGKNVPGSHVIAFDDGNGISDRTIEEAAMLAAYYSRASSSNQIPVDYTRVKEIKKPQGGRPGMVIYHTNYTLYTTPDENLIKKMEEKNEKTIDKF